jgi:ribose transport system substrate-binding protein
MRGRILAVLIITLGVMVVTSCDRSSSTGSSSTSATKPATEKPRVALMMKSLANEFFRTMQSGAEAHQKSDGSYDLISDGIKNETDVERQISLVEQMAAQRVDAIVIAPADSKALVPVLKKASDAGIVVVNIDNKLDTEALSEKSLKVPFVGPDNAKGAKLAGDYLAGKLSKGDAVAIIDGAPGAFNAIQRHAGFEAAMKQGGMNVVTSQSAHWESDKATPLVASILNGHPEIKAVLCANDSMALGAHVALRDAGKIKQVKLVGFDNIPAVQELIKSGDVLCTVDQHADQIAVNGIKYALEILKTKQAPADRETPVDLITAENLTNAK